MPTVRVKVGYSCDLITTVSAIESASLVRYQAAIVPDSRKENLRLSARFVVSVPFYFR